MISLAYIVTVLFALDAVSQGDEESSTHDSKALSKKWIDSTWSSYSSAFSSSSYYSGSYIGLTPWMMTSWSTYYGSSINILGYRIMPQLYSPLFFSKVSDKHSVDRRAVLRLDDDRLHRRGSDESVSCVNEKGVTHLFLKSDCLKAADKLSEKKLSSASCGQCTLSLVTPHGRVAPKSI